MENKQNPSPRTLALWSAPRARSTVFFRAMVERGDHIGLHEPFCNIMDFGATTVEGREVHTHRALVGAIRDLSKRRPVFLKDTTDHRYQEVLEDADFLREVVHTFLVRSPDQIAASYFALRPEMGEGDIGLIQLHELYEAVIDAGGRAIVIDSEDLVRAPARTLSAYCREVGIAYDPAALEWEPGGRPEWERSKRWHVGASESSGIHGTVTEYADTVDNNPMLAAFSDHHRPAYRALRDRKLVIA
ncbi:sulfotransferase-like domain-containing protein [Nocardiopsis sp. NPDC055551]